MTTSRSSLITLISVFFFWGFVAASNTVLIPIFKSHFTLLQWQSQLVDFAFYIAYTFGSLVYFLISITAGDPLNKIGYKKGLILGLCISALGALGFVPAAAFESFTLMLTALFVIALGFALQQIVANPYIISLGDPATGAHRSSLAQGVNSFGTTLGPLLLGYAIFGGLTVQTETGLDAIRMPYTILACLFIVFAVILALSKLPPITIDEHTERTIGALKFPQLVLGMVAIFVYVGTEVTIQSNLPELMRRPEILGLESSQTIHFVSLFWGSLMIGRWTGAIRVFEPSSRTKTILTVVVPLIAFGVILAVNFVKLHAAGQSHRMNDLYEYTPFVLLLIALFLTAREKPAFTLMLFGASAAVLMLIGILAEGKLALLCFVGGGLFCSIMWPSIFALSIAGLGKYTNQGSSLLVMMIAGGAILPPLQGYLADRSNIHLSYLIPLLGFLYLAFYGWKVRQILARQGIDYEGGAK